MSASVKDVREIVAKAEQRLGERGQGTILFLDEVHRFNKAQQDALLPSVETGLLVLVGATTENPYFEVNAPLLSRSTLFRLQPLDEAAVSALLRKGLDAEGADADPEALAHLAERAGGDGRHALTSLEVAVALARARQPGVATPTVGTAEPRPPGHEADRYGRDEHYDVISAFIKSIRGSDPQAALHYLARMLEAGEDARFVARRLVILASEDVGEADPMSLVVATAAAHAVEYVGLPEAQLNLAQAVVHLATAPKSNRSAAGIWQAREDVAKGLGGEVPMHLRDAHYRSATSLGHGVGYDYPHDDPRVGAPAVPSRRRARRRLLPAVAPRIRAGDRRPHASIGRRRRRRGGGHVSASDLAAIIVAACSVVAVVLLAVGLVALVRTLRALRQVTDLLRTETAPVIDDLRDTIEAANYEIVRLDGLVSTAESVTGTVDSASRLAYIAMANPVIKGVAFASGTAKAARRLRGRKDA